MWQNTQLSIPVASSGSAPLKPVLDCVAAQLASAIPLAGKIVVLCDVWRDSLRPSPLRTAGARVATLNCIPESLERKFVGEGHPVVLAELRKMLAQDRRKLIELRQPSGPCILAGVHLGSHVLLPSIAAAAQSLRAAGFPRAEAVSLVEALGYVFLRAYGKAGDKDSESCYRRATFTPEAIRSGFGDALRLTCQHYAWRLSSPTGTTGCCAISR